MTTVGNKPSGLSDVRGAKNASPMFVHDSDDSPRVSLSEGMTKVAPIRCKSHIASFVLASCGKTYKSAFGKNFLTEETVSESTV